MTLSRSLFAILFVAGCVLRVGAAPESSFSHDTPLPLTLNPNAVAPLAAPVAPESAYGQAMPLRTRATAINPDRELHVGDQVSLEIVEDKTGPMPKIVTATGEIDVPPLGRVHVAGKSCAQIEADLKRKLEADYYYTATVRVAIDAVTEEQVVYGKVYIKGAVKAPGLVLLDPGEHITVSNIILKAGGFAQFAASDNVRVTRRQKNGERQTFAVNVLGVWKASRNVEDPEVLDGDNIFVPQKAINF
jgi:polysaccharide export outer membrane protein